MQSSSNANFLDTVLYLLREWNDDLIMEQWFILKLTDS